MNELHPAFTIFIYFIPAIVGYLNRHNSRDAILITNLLLGWTVIGWIFALIWSFTGNREKRNSN